jgi:hypothetical protein
MPFGAGRRRARGVVLAHRSVSMAAVGDCSGSLACLPPSTDRLQQSERGTEHPPALRPILAIRGHY